MSRVIPALLSALCALAPVHAQDNARLTDGLQGVLDTFHDRYGVPGTTAAIAMPDSTVIVAATGLADVEAGTPDSRMLAASIGKTFMAATVPTLENEGRLSHADLLANHLGKRPWFSDLPNAQAITIRHLRLYRSGLPDHVYLPAFQSSGAQMASGDTVAGREDLIDFVTGTDPLFDAGTAWANSDTGYLLLGLAIEEVTTSTWQEVVRTRFLDPLKLTGNFPSDRRKLPGFAIGYVAAENPFGLPARTADAEGRLLWNPAPEGAGEGFASTSHDLARWGHLLFGGDAMLAPYLDRLLEPVAVNTDGSGILHGSGVAIDADPPRGPVYGHGGWVPTYVSRLRHAAEHGVTVAFPISTDAGFLDGTSDLAPALEAAPADVAIKALP